MPTAEEARVSQQHRIWEDWAQADPLWAILSDPTRKGGRWDLGEFFSTGTAAIQLVREQLRTYGIDVRTGRCLDFGCGVGRLTQALAAVFTEADGIDISETMIELARRHNRFGDQCRYHVNVAPDLSLFGDGVFDFVFSTMVLQHIPAQDAQGYIEEFIRILATGGVAVFDMTSHFKDTKIPESGHRADLTRLTEVPPLSAGQPFAVEIDVWNASGSDWPAGVVVTVGNHWRRADGELVTLDDGRSRFAMSGLPTGRSERVGVTVTAPAEPGHFLLEFDPVEEGVTWFADRGSRTATVLVEVLPPVGVAAVAGADPAGDPFLGSLAAAPAAGIAAAGIAVAGIAEPGIAAPGITSAALPAGPVAMAVPTEDPPAFTMNGLTRAEVQETLRRCGARLVAIEPNSTSGPEWATYRYFVVRD